MNAKHQHGNQTTQKNHCLVYNSILSCFSTQAPQFKPFCKSSKQVCLTHLDKTTQWLQTKHLPQPKLLQSKWSQLITCLLALLQIIPSLQIKSQQTICQLLMNEDRLVFRSKERHHKTKMSKASGDTVRLLQAKHRRKEREATLHICQQLNLLVFVQTKKA